MIEIEQFHVLFPGQIVIAQGGENLGGLLVLVARAFGNDHGRVRVGPYRVDDRARELRVGGHRKRRGVDQVGLEQDAPEPGQGGRAARLFEGLAHGARVVRAPECDDVAHGPS